MTVRCATARAVAGLPMPADRWRQAGGNGQRLDTRRPGRSQQTSTVIEGESLRELLSFQLPPTLSVRQGGWGARRRASPRFGDAGKSDQAEQGQSGEDERASCRRRVFSRSRRRGGDDVQEKAGGPRKGPPHSAGKAVGHCHERGDPRAVGKPEIFAFKKPSVKQADGRTERHRGPASPRPTHRSPSARSSAPANLGVRGQCFR